MKRIALMLAILLIPAALMAQDKDQSVLASTSTADSATNTAASDGRGDHVGAGNATVTADSSANTGRTASPSQAGKASQSTKPEKPSRPPIEGSMVGYIDNPIVQSQVRIRFEAAFSDKFPDRDEFFYAKCGCYRGAGLDPNAPGPPPGSGVVIPSALNFQQLYFYGEFAPVRRFSLFTEVPIRWIQAQGLLVGPPNSFPSEGGLSDVMAGFKFAAIATDKTYLTFQFRSYFPSGDASKGLGTNHYSIEPELLLYQRLTDRLTLEGQVGDWHPIGGSAGVVPSSGALAPPGSEGFAGDIFIYGIGPSYQLYRGERVRISPVLELVGWTVLSGFETHVTASGVASEVGGTNIVNMKLGIRTNVGSHNSFYIGYGQALTSANWYEQIMRAEYRYSF